MLLKKYAVLFPTDVTNCSFKRDGERMRMTAITITVVVIMEVYFFEKVVIMDVEK